MKYKFQSDLTWQYKGTAVASRNLGHETQGLGHLGLKIELDQLAGIEIQWSLIDRAAMSNTILALIPLFSLFASVSYPR